MMQDAARIFLIAYLLLFSLFSELCAEDRLKAAILISTDIKPYFEAAESIQKFFDKNKIESETYSLQKSNVLEELDTKFLGKKVAIIIAIGPEALELADNRYSKAEIPVIYTMILNPEKKVGNIKAYCGIPFFVPIRLQLQYIAKALPDVKRLGILYDPKNNEAIFEQASETAPNYDIGLVKLTVSSSKVTQVLNENLSNIDALLLIPDKSVIFESVIQHIIREAVEKKIPVIGYNRFFYESGAAVSFIFDYEEIGEQTAKLAIDMLHRNTCSENTPIFHVWLNPRVMKKLGRRMTDKESFPIEIRP